jgi:hypothetical protein
MKILFLNVNSRMIELYGEEGVVKIPFENAGQLYTYVEDDNILYITNAVQTNAQEVISMIKGMGVMIQEDIPVDTGVKYLHSPAKGTIYINEFLKFEGEFDTKLIDESMTTTIQTNELLRQLIKTKKIEIIGEMKRRKLMLKYKDSQAEKLIKQEEIDASLDSIIVKTSVENMIDGGITSNDHPSAEIIDLESMGSAVEGGRINTMSELMSEIEGL